MGVPILQGVQHGGDQIPGVEGPGLSRLQVHLHPVGLLHLADALLQGGQVIAGPGNVVAAPKVHPLHLGQQIPERCLHCFQGHSQGVSVLLAKGVEVEAIQQLRQLRVGRHGGIPLGPGGAQAAAGGTGVIDGMALLGGALGVYPQAHALACRLGRRAKLGQLAGGVEHDVVGVLQQLCELVCPVGGAEHMVLLFRQLLPAQAALVQAAGLGACQVGGQHRVHIKVGKGLLGQQGPASGALLQLQHDLPIPAQLGLVQQVAGGRQALQLLFRQVCQPCKGRAAILQPHQSTRAGLWLSLRGRPY